MLLDVLGKTLHETIVTSFVKYIAHAIQAIPNAAPVTPGFCNAICDSVAVFQAEFSNRNSPGKDVAFPIRLKFYVDNLFDRHPVETADRAGPKRQLNRNGLTPAC